MPELLNLVAGLIKELRNSRDVAANWQKFYLVVQQNQDEIIADFSLKWLRSICDTFADYGDVCDRRDAMVISVFINMIKLAEMVRYVHGDLVPEHVKTARGGFEFYDGITTFDIDRQDIFLNMSKRLTRQLSNSGIFNRMWQEVIRRLLDGDNVITEFRNLSAMPERYFPLNPLNMADNYGVV